MSNAPASKNELDNAQGQKLAGELANAQAPKSESANVQGQKPAGELVNAQVPKNELGNAQGQKPIGELTNAQAPKYEGQKPAGELANAQPPKSDSTNAQGQEPAGELANAQAPKSEPAGELSKTRASKDEPGNVQTEKQAVKPAQSDLKDEGAQAREKEAQRLQAEQVARQLSASSPQSAASPTNSVESITGPKVGSGLKLADKGKAVKEKDQVKSAKDKDHAKDAKSRKDKPTKAEAAEKKEREDAIDDATRNLSGSEKAQVESILRHSKIDNELLKDITKDGFSINVISDQDKILRDKKGNIHEGVFNYGDNKIRLSESAFRNPKELEKVLSDELGHRIDDRLRENPETSAKWSNLMKDYSTKERKDSKINANAASSQGEFGSEVISSYLRGGKDEQKLKDNYPELYNIVKDTVGKSDQSDLETKPQGLFGRFTQAVQAQKNQLTGNYFTANTQPKPEDHSAKAVAAADKIQKGEGSGRSASEQSAGKASSESTSGTGGNHLIGDQQGASTQLAAFSGGGGQTGGQPSSKVITEQNGSSGSNTQGVAGNQLLGSSQQPAVAKQPVDTQQPAVAQQPVDTRQPAVAKQPVDTQQPAVAQQPADTRQPAVAQQPADAQQPAVAPQPAGGQQLAAGKPGEVNKGAGETGQPAKVTESGPKPSAPSAPAPQDANTSGQPAQTPPRDANTQSPGQPGLSNNQGGPSSTTSSSGNQGTSSNQSNYYNQSNSSNQGNYYNQGSYSNSSNYYNSSSNYYNQSSSFFDNSNLSSFMDQSLFSQFEQSGLSSMLQDNAFQSLGMAQQDLMALDQSLSQAGGLQELQKLSQGLQGLDGLPQELKGLEGLKELAPILQNVPETLEGLGKVQNLVDRAQNLPGNPKDFARNPDVRSLLQELPGATRQVSGLGGLARGGSALSSQMAQLNQVRQVGDNLQQLGKQTQEWKDLPAKLDQVSQALPLVRTAQQEGSLPTAPDANFGQLRGQEQGRRDERPQSVINPSGRSQLQGEDLSGLKNAGGMPVGPEARPQLLAPAEMQRAPQAPGTRQPGPGQSLVQPQGPVSQSPVAQPPRGGQSQPPVHPQGPVSQSPVGQPPVQPQRPVSQAPVAQPPHGGQSQPQGPVSQGPMAQPPRGGQGQPPAQPPGPVSQGPAAQPPRGGQNQPPVQSPGPVSQAPAAQPPRGGQNQPPVQSPGPVSQAPAAQPPRGGQNQPPVQAPGPVSQGPAAQPPRGGQGQPSAQPPGPVSQGPMAQPPRGGQGQPPVQSPGPVSQPVRAPQGQQSLPPVVTRIQHSQAAPKMPATPAIAKLDGKMTQRLQNAPLMARQLEKLPQAQQNLKTVVQGLEKTSQQPKGLEALQRTAQDPGALHKGLERLEQLVQTPQDKANVQKLRKTLDPVLTDKKLGEGLKQANQALKPLGESAGRQQIHGLKRVQLDTPASREMSQQLRQPAVKAPMQRVSEGISQAREMERATEAQNNRLPHLSNEMTQDLGESLAKIISEAQAANRPRSLFGIQLGGGGARAGGAAPVGGPAPAPARTAAPVRPAPTAATQPAASQPGPAAQAKPAVKAGPTPKAPGGQPKETMSKARIDAYRQTYETVKEQMIGKSGKDHAWALVYHSRDAEGAKGLTDTLESNVVKGGSGKMQSWLNDMTKTPDSAIALSAILANVANVAPDRMMGIMLLTTDGAGGKDTVGDAFNKMSQNVDSSLRLAHFLEKSSEHPAAARGLAELLEGQTEPQGESWKSANRTAETFRGISETVGGARRLTQTLENLGEVEGGNRLVARTINRMTREQDGAVNTLETLQNLAHDKEGAGQLGRVLSRASESRDGARDLLGSFQSMAKSTGGKQDVARLFVRLAEGGQGARLLANFVKDGNNSHHLAGVFEQLNQNKESKALLAHALDQMAKNPRQRSNYEIFAGRVAASETLQTAIHETTGENEKTQEVGEAIAERYPELPKLRPLPSRALENPNEVADPNLHKSADLQRVSESWRAERPSAAESQAPAAASALAQAERPAEAPAELRNFRPGDVYSEETLRHARICGDCGGRTTSLGLCPRCATRKQRSQAQAV
ncbi:MAG: hypothetical protein KIS61_19515 [Candidatus Eremiobacteraeota bacterium]|nr:hypothetical protein [Candidatus Eremiobacteraeota bacterium]